MRKLLSIVCLGFLIGLLLPYHSSIPQSELRNPQSAPGQSVTLLPDGRWLLVGGEGPDGSPLDRVLVYNPHSPVSTQSFALNQARAWHTATMLPNGSVLIFGGVGANGQVLASPEIFDPETRTFELLPNDCCLLPRSRHTATLLTDGRLLVAGGVGSDGPLVDTAELFNPQSLVTQSSSLTTQSLSLSVARQGHTATLLSDGRVLLSGGQDKDGNPLDTGDVFDPSSEQFTPVLVSEVQNLKSEIQNPELVASLPADGSVEVPTDTVISLRFSKPLQVKTVNSDTVALTGPNGAEKIKVVAAEGGMLAFITPEAPLVSGTTYTITLNGPIDREGLLLPLSGFSFTTESSAISSQLAGSITSPSSSSQPSAVGSQPLASSSEPSDDWNWTGELRDGKPHSPWQDVPPLQAEPGVTALAGQVLDLKGDPLANVTLEVEGPYGSGKITAQTDESGRFLLKYVMSGWCELIIDGRLAHNPKSKIENPKWGYGVFEYGLEIKEGETNLLPFTSWLPKIDSANAVKISSPTISEVIVTTSRIPGLEVRIPPNTVIYDHQHKVVTEVSITPIPLDRTPFPLPRGLVPPALFTIQPGAAYVYGSEGVRLVYPNYRDHPELPGARFSFWHYDPKGSGWYVYGQGTVAEDGKQIFPDPGVAIYEFTGAMVTSDTTPPATGPAPGAAASGGDPVDLGTGLFVLEKTDLFLPDVLPITLTRTYRPGDTNSRPFGVGATHPYAIFLWWTVIYWEADLVLPDGSRIHYARNSWTPGTVLEHHGPTGGCPTCVGTPTIFHGSVLRQTVLGWDLKLKGGTVYHFSSFRLESIQDRYGNQITITRADDANTNITKITSPNGRSIEFTYDASNRITQAKDNIGRTVSYTYDATGRLSTVTDPSGGITQYTYDASSRMLTIKDARGIVFLTNEYDADGRVIKQTQADLTTYQFAYTLSGSTVAQTDVTDPRSNLRRVTFNSSGYPLTDVRAVGQPEEQTTTYERQAATNLILFATDALNRKTAYTYDAMGNVTNVTRLSATAEAVTTTFTYEQTFHQLASITDPLNHTTTFAYDIQGNLTSVTNPLNQITTLAYDIAGRPISITDPLNNTTQFTYDLGDLVAVTDPLGSSTTRFIDSVGRLALLTNPLGNATRYDYDALNRLTKVTDALNGVTNFSYDPNGNLLSVTDAKTQSTTYTYNNMDRLATRTDPLLRAESHLYDNNGNLSQFTDRKSQAITFTYDALDRKTKATYADLSATTYTYDKGNRLTQIVDSISGTVTRTYDNLDRFTSETTPQGSVSYTYNAAGRRTSMTVAGQPTISYTYDDSNRLIQITQGAPIVSFIYDAAGRRRSLTLPNGVLVEYTYDGDSRVTGISYEKDLTVLGNLAYEYDKAGNRKKVGGSFARTGIPQAISTASYNAANQQTTFGDKTLTYDNNGNLTSITDVNGTTLYTWNARNQLIGISGPGLTASFVYDGVGRREKKTINSSLTEFLFDGVNPVQETSGAVILANILGGLGIDEFFTRTDVGVGTTGHFLPDGLGSTLALADSLGTVQTEYTYEPFGRTVATGAGSLNPFQFTGRENDGTGLHYYRARYYHPQLQRFISEDPFNLSSMRLMGQAGSRQAVAHYLFRQLLRDPRQLHAYSYVLNNPMGFDDPYGLLAVIGGAGGSAVVRYGYEGSGGAYYDWTTGEVGWFTSVGGGGGLNVSYDIFGGVIFGELQGVTTNTNLVLGGLSLTFLFDPLTGEFVGFTAGYGPPIFGVPFFGLSQTVDYTASQCLLGCRK